MSNINLGVTFISEIVGCGLTMRRKYEYKLERWWKKDTVSHLMTTEMKKKTWQIRDWNMSDKKCVGKRCVRFEASKRFSQFRSISFQEFTTLNFLFLYQLNNTAWALKRFSPFSNNNMTLWKHHSKVIHKAERVKSNGNKISDPKPANWLRHRKKKFTM